jgi:hypothetical protein
MFLACILPIAIIICFIISSSKTRYELASTELAVKFGLVNKKIAYTEITYIEKVQLTLGLKIFGAGMPGFYWGTFITSIGNAQVYCTKLCGEYIALTLTDGQKIVLSPKNNEQFFNALNQQKSPFKPIATQQISQSRKQIANKFIYAQILMVTGAYCMFLSYFFIVYSALPQMVTLQFDFNGAISRWGVKTELLWLAGIPAILPIFNAVFALKFGKYTRNLLIVLGITFIAIITMFALIISGISIPHH